MKNNFIIKLFIFLPFLRFIFTKDILPYEERIIDTKRYNDFCQAQNKFKCIHGMSACQSKGYIQIVYTFGACEKPPAYECLDPDIEKCDEDSLCILQYSFASVSESIDFCVNPDVSVLDCLKDCASKFEVCSGQGYYEDDKGVCKKMNMENRAVECEGKLFCKEDHDFNLCKIYGYEGYGDYKCTKIDISTCLEEDNFYCNGPQSFCVKQAGFEYNKLTNSCDINCLEGFKCQEDDSFCLKNGRYDRLNNQGRCYLKITLSECIEYVDDCPLACQKGYNLIHNISDNKCQLPLHSVCDLAIENSIYGCSQDKETCKYMGWIQNEKGSNKCKMPTNCIGSETKCKIGDFYGTLQGNYLGLINKGDGNGFIYPSINDCLNHDLCQRADSECRRFGYENQAIISSGTYYSCQSPSFESCYTSNTCSSKFETMCQKKYGFVAEGDGRKCVVPTNCSSLKKGELDKHACELIEYESVDKNYNFVLLTDIFSTLDMNQIINYNIIYDFCERYTKYTSPICSSETSLCRKIGFQTDKTGKCIFPQPEDCLKVGGQMCSSVGICLRKFNYQKSENNDCVLPFEGDYKKCAGQIDNNNNINNYCKQYYGQPFYTNLSTYCTDSAQKRCSDSNSFCVKYLGYKVTANKICSTPTTSPSYILFNNYSSSIYTKVQTPLQVYNSCSVSKSCSPLCSSIGFVYENGVCKTPVCNLESYNHACHLTRQINPSDIAAKCIDQPNCSQYCVYIGFVVDANDNNKCKLPQEADCNIILQTTDIYYHACNFRNYGTDQQDISFYCLQKGKNRCSPSSICVLSYKFEAQQNSDCILPIHTNCLPQSPPPTEKIILYSVSCKIHFNFITYALKSIYKQSITSKDVNLKEANSNSLYNEFRFVSFKSIQAEPEPLQCLNKILQLCKQITRFKNGSEIDTNYLTPCQTFGFQSASDGSCFVDPNICIDPNTNCISNQACQTKGFIADPVSGNKMCYIMDKDQFYCDPSQKYKEKLELCEQYGYKWVTDHYELPSQQECEEDKNNYCGKGKVACTSRGWTADAQGKCSLTMNCLEENKYNCLNDDFICSYVGYILKPNQASDSFDCVAPADLNCTEKGKNHCQSKTFSLCTQLGYVQDTNNDCKCESIVYQGKCIQIQTKGGDSTKTDTSAYHLLFNIYTLLALLLIMNV